MMIQAAMYAIRPPMNAPGTIDRTIQSRRMKVTSASRYSARPAQTPAIRPADVLRYKRFGMVFSCYVPLLDDIQQPRLRRSEPADGTKPSLTEIESGAKRMPRAG